MSDKNILVLCASPREKGNSEKLADAFTEGAVAAGNEVTKINVTNLNISGCRACNGCWESSGNCIIEDDMKKLEILLEKADVLVLATPLYWSMVPAQMKAPIDRVYQYDPVSGGKKLHIAESVLLTCGETENEEDFEIMKKFYTFFAEWNGMKIRDIITVTNMHNKNDIDGNPALTKARELGSSF